MPPLEKNLKAQLERTIKKARQIAEDAARMVLENLGVAEPVPFPHLNKKELELHQSLRIHGRQLGDALDTVSGALEIGLLIKEVAYEHWHRMLFARYLAENNLLMYPDPEMPVAITLEECEGLALKEGATNGFELAARFATKMLPQIFRVDSPVFELTFPPESTQKLERLLGELPKEIFIASDSLGWVYQFWQTTQKTEVYSKAVKIGPRELPAVTQIFTEPYLVNFLLDNSLGAWWAGKRLKDYELKNAANEEELRQKAALPGMPLEYLRFVKQDDGTFVPAAGFFPSWPEKISDLKLLDPCCGSGHFLVAAFLMLLPLRMELESLSAQEAVNAVLRENIYGLELDRRCIELAAFALALAAWKYEAAGGYRPLPELNLACSGLSLNLSQEELKKLRSELKKLTIPSNKKLTIFLKQMLESFKDAPLLGSLLNPLKNPSLNLLQWNDLKNISNDTAWQEENEELMEEIEVIQKLAKAAQILAGQYHLVITNVPYLSNRKETLLLRDYCKKNYPEAHHDLATVFLERSLEFCVLGGTTSIVIPQNLLFLRTFKKLREKLLKENKWHFFVRLGFGTFKFSTVWNQNIILISLSRGKSNNLQRNFHSKKDFKNEKNLICGIDVSAAKNTSSKAELIKTSEIVTVSQDKQLDNPDFIIGLEERTIKTFLNFYAKSLTGIQSGDDSHFRRYFWELPEIFGDWVYWQSTSRTNLHYGGQIFALWMGEDFKIATNNHQTRIQGIEAWKKVGLVLDQIGELHASIHTGEKHDNNCAVVLPYDAKDLPAIWCFCSSPSFHNEVRKIDQKLNVTNATLVKVPFEHAFWAKVAQEKYPYGLPEPYSNDPTQWIFHGHPSRTVIFDDQKKQTVLGPFRIDETVLQIAVARLLGYKWPAEIDKSLKLAKEQREIIKSCDSLSVFTNKDGIVVIPSVRGEPSASDRLLNLLAAAYGNSWTNATLRDLLKSVDQADKSIETWLRNKFFTQHSKLFKNRPFIWHIWDGHKKGFAALINYHKLDYKLLETLIYSYLGDWIRHQKNEISKNVDGAKELLDSALSLQKKLELILIGEAPYDIFVRWKPLDHQVRGWNPDLNDGVRLNIRPFLTAPSFSKKGAGILKDKPNIHWKKDLGKDHTSAPWYQTFQGDRINDYHLSLAEKAKKN
ncbi:MAG: SAM-dependent DNA methyltransferase [Deltaproteobacteria bacterium]|jgi:hypothetical protein|nr:SAM-dependent DNA methyltransferase [Deltaproteobacteria bacterium]